MPRSITSLNNLLFDPSLKRKVGVAAPVRNKSLNNIGSIAQNITGSFRFDPPGSALKSTQQLNVDFSNFENHTFFNSAQAKVQKSFSKIINNFPFDGSKNEVDTFLDSLNGFEKYVFDNFPRSLGYLIFSGSSSPSTNEGSYIIVNDYRGSFSPNLSKNATGQSTINFGTGPFTAEFYINIPSGSVNDNSIILQKISGNNGLTVALTGSHFSESPQGVTEILAVLSSGSIFLSASMPILKGRFEHCAVVYDNILNPGQIKLYLNSQLINSSSFSSFGQIDFINSPLTIGSGTVCSAGNFTFTPQSTLSGALDEFRFWHKAKTQKEIYKQKNINVFSDPNLKLYYRFNEPSGSFSGAGAGLVLDQSGNGLHSRINNFSMALKNSSTFGNTPLIEENVKDSPILFPTFSDVVSFNSTLLSSASIYDFNNPNLVTKLIPVHYFAEAQIAENFTNLQGNVSNVIGSNQDEPGGARTGQAQIISSLLYTMAETFDEFKMFVDEFKKLLKVDYITQDTISDQLLPWLGKYYGIRLPNAFAQASLRQLQDGQDVTITGNPTVGLQAIQNTLWRRIFSDLPKNLATRGTIESLKSTLRNFGINADGPVRIRELGGANVFYLGDSFIQRHEIASMIDFSGSFAGSLTSVNAQGFSATMPYLISSYLSASRIEKGFPEIVGNSNDGLLTSGSWTFEGTYKFLETLNHASPQSLARIYTTGSSSPADSGMLTFNILAYAENLETLQTGSVQLWGRPNYDLTSPTLVLNLTGVNVFDGDKWQISFGRQRNDEINSYVSSSYFLRASKFTVGGLESYQEASAYFNDNEPLSTRNTLQVGPTGSPSYNASGSFVVIGTNTVASSAGVSGLNNSSISSLARTSIFSGKVSGIRFWSKALSSKEAKMHAKNFKSLGVEDPAVNYNFVTNATGSFERLRFDFSVDQPVTNSNLSKDFSLKDFSQNNFIMTGSGFEGGVSVIKPERFDFETLSPDFRSENPNKIRIRSYLDRNTAELNGVSQAPLHIIPQNEEPKDDKRVMIEVNALQALNEDIMNIFATLDYLDNLIGSPELVFSQDYPSLRNLRRIYFNRLTNKVNFNQVFQFFKWFDDSIGDYLEQMLPYDTKMFGVSFVIEPHAMERPKFIYNYYGLYLSEDAKRSQQKSVSEIVTVSDGNADLRKS